VNVVGSYRANISESFVGALGRSSDVAGCEGRSDVSGVTGSSNIGLTSGTIGLADPAGIGNGGGDANAPFSPSTSAFIDRLSNGSTQSHTLTFTWNGSVRSNSCEAAIRPRRAERHDFGLQRVWIRRQPRANADERRSLRDGQHHQLLR
jgi:hypothetical protein